MIETRGLSVRYGDVTAIQDATVSIPAGAITAIVGPSGCGKSSFLAALNRMTDRIPAAQVSGEVRIDCCARAHTADDPVGLRRCVGMVFQKPTPFPLSIRRNVELALREHGIGDARERPALVERALVEVGLWEEVRDRLDRPATTLSGGQQQRLCIARALALQPAVLLMDEPCSALDPLAAARVEDLILELRGRHNVVVVTHNLAQARRIADHLVVFWHLDGAGRVLESGPAARVLEAPAHPLTRSYFEGSRG